jgi:hypothetical protein
VTRLRFVALLALTLLLAGAGPFDGCGGPGSGDPRPLPRSDGGACFFDSDCVPAGCEQLSCIAGLCQETAPIRDMDGDTHAPPPCGMDCDDTDERIAPMVTEQCDLVDQDCDGRVDEMAMPRALVHRLTTIDETMAMVAWGDEVLVTDDAFSRMGVRARVLGLDGALGTPQRLFDTPLDVVAADAVPTADGAAFALQLRDPSTSDQLVAILRVTRAADGTVMPPGAPSMHVAPSARPGIAVAAIGDAIVTAWDAGTQRLLWSPAWPSAIVVADSLVEGVGPLDLASDGANAVVPVGARRLAFHTPADGALVGTADAGGALGIGRPIAADGTNVATLVSDGTDYVFRHVTLAGGAGPTSRLPVGGTPLSIDSSADGYLLLRSREDGTRAWILERSDPSVLSQTFSPTDLGAASRGEFGIEVSVVPSGIAILTNYGAAGASLAVLACSSGT